MRNSSVPSISLCGKVLLCDGGGSNGIVAVFRLMARALAFNCCLRVGYRIFIDVIAN